MSGERDRESTRMTDVRVLAPPTAGKRFALQMIQGPGAPREFPLVLEQTVVGRGKDADVCIDSMDLSRTHMKLVLRDGEVLCLDMGSTHGVFVNGVKVHSCVLRQGDTVQAGNVVFTYVEKSEPVLEKAE